MASPRFSPKTLAFLRGLKRNNNRDWFNARKGDFEQFVRAPMLEVVEQLAMDFKHVAPELAAGPKSLFRIYRDTRFSADKSPYKTSASAVFPHKHLPKLGGAGLYFEVTPTWVWAGGGLHTPDTPLLQKEREHIATNFRRFRAIIESPAFRRNVGQLDGGEKLQRVPRGFSRDEAAAEYLRCRMFIAGHEFPAAFATSPRFYAGLLNVFKHMAPLIRFLNEPLVKKSA
jgi:uncharacterized protein (TIGR02453 family)